MENIIDLCLQKPAVSVKKKCMPLWKSETVYNMGLTYVNGHSYKGEPYANAAIQLLANG